MIWWVCTSFTSPDSARLLPKVLVLNKSIAPAPSHSSMYTRWHFSIYFQSLKLWGFKIFVSFRLMKWILSWFSFATFPWFHMRLKYFYMFIGPFGFLFYKLPHYILDFFFFLIIRFFVFFSLISWPSIYIQDLHSFCLACTQAFSVCIYLNIFFLLLKYFL